MNAHQPLVEEMLPVLSADGVGQTLRVFRPAAPAFSPWLVLGLPAMGTPASYYEPFARAVADGLHAVVAFADLRGQGTSSVRASSGDRFGYREILEADLPAILAALRLVGFGGRQPHTLMRDWLDVVASGRYRPRGSNLDYESRCRFASFDLLEVGIEGDPVAPPESRDELVTRFDRAHVTRAALQCSSTWSPWRKHFAWTRETDAMAATLMRWVRSRRRVRLQPFDSAERTLIRCVA